MHSSGALRREREVVCGFDVIASAAKRRSNPSFFFFAALWIASLRSQ
jgi:hypothetical protein